MDNYQDNAPHYTQADWNWMRDQRDAALARASKAEAQVAALRGAIQDNINTFDDTGVLQGIHIDALEAGLLATTPESTEEV